MSSYRKGFFNVIRWPKSDGAWWLVAESDNGYIPVLQLHPHWNKNRDLEPTWDNQLYRAAELLTEKGMEALNNPHAMIGKTCGCRECFTCAALKVYRLANVAAARIKTTEVIQ